MTIKITSLVEIMHYDGPVEFVGQYEIGEGYAKSVFGFWTDDEDSSDRTFSVWGRTEDGKAMEFLGDFLESEIDWPNG